MILFGYWIIPIFESKSNRQILKILSFYRLFSSVIFLKNIIIFFLEVEVFKFGASLGFMYLDLVGEFVNCEVRKKGHKL